MWRALVTFFNWREGERGTAYNPMTQLRSPTRTRMFPRVYLDAEVDAILSAAPKRQDRALVELILNTGLTLAEAADLKWPSVERHAVRIEGGNPPRRIPLSTRVRRIMEGLGDGHNIWLGTRGPLSASGVSLAIRRTVRAAGLKPPGIGPNTFRHTFAYRYLRCGGDEFSLQHILGHLDGRAVLMYAGMVAADSGLPKTTRRRARSHRKFVQSVPPATAPDPPPGSIISSEHLRHGRLFELSCPNCDGWAQSYCVCITWQGLLRELHKHHQEGCADNREFVLPGSRVEQAELLELDAMLCNAVCDDGLAVRIAGDDPHFWKLRTSLLEMRD